MPNYDPPLQKVLDKVGGPSKLALHLGVGASAVTQWEKVPARHVPRVAALTGIPGQQIRPDLYAPLPEVGAA
jgi:DNA-binding transcriptional regulator YdaS (Cro superfamily)